MPLHRGLEIRNCQGGGEDPGDPVRPQRRTRLHPLGERSRVRRQGRKALAGELGSEDPLRREPGSPWEIAYSETFRSRLGDELLKREKFTSLLEAKVLVEEYRNYYNQERPHSALGYRTPAEFVASCEPASTGEVLTKELESVIALS